MKNLKDRLGIVYNEVTKVVMDRINIKTKNEENINTLKSIAEILEQTKKGFSKKKCYENSNAKFGCCAARIFYCWKKYIIKDL